MFKNLAKREKKKNQSAQQIVAEGAAAQCYGYCVPLPM